MKRTLQKTVVIAIVAFVSMAAYGQLFRPLGLGTGMGLQENEYSQPRMHVEGDTLYVCTNQGLYCKDLSDDESAWQLAGFEGIPLQDYVRKGSDMLALRYNVDGGFFLLSHDGGRTYEDVTPEMFNKHFYGGNVILALTQHPGDPNTLLVSSYYMGLLQSSDFGKTWNKLTGAMYGTFMGYHPLKPEIIYNSGMNDISEPCINISYDGGQTWNYLSLDFPGDNCAYCVAFHPTDPDRWIAGGQSTVYTSADNGQTWNTQDLSGDGRYEAIWNFAAYDNENSDIVYMAGRQNEIEIICSTDGGQTWNIPQTNPIKKTETELVNDMQQYGNKLLIYTEADVYEISKAELILQSTVSVQSITSTTLHQNSLTTYDLQGRPATGKPQHGVYIQGGRIKARK